MLGVAERLGREEAQRHRQEEQRVRQAQRRDQEEDLEEDLEHVSLAGGHHDHREPRGEAAVKDRGANLLQRHLRAMRGRAGPDDEGVRRMNDVVD